MMRDGLLTYQTLQDAARFDIKDAAERIFALDCYAGEGDVEAGNSDLYVFLLSQFGANGVFLIYNGRDVAYSLIYPIAREESGFGVEEGLLEGRNRIGGWKTMLKYVNESISTAYSINDVWHLYDYAVKSRPLHELNSGAEDPLRKIGLGRLVLRMGNDVSLDNNDISIGFIDDTKGEKHLTSLLASTKSGELLGKQSPVSHDGDHTSILCLFSKSVNFYLKDESMVVEQPKSLNDFAENVRKVTNSEKAFVYFDRSKKKFLVLTKK
jgi:hypothetical protein